MDNNPQNNKVFLNIPEVFLNLHQGARRRAQGNQANHLRAIGNWEPGEVSRAPEQALYIMKKVTCIRSDLRINCLTQYWGSWTTLLYSEIKRNEKFGVFPGGTMDRNLPAHAEDMGSIPSQGRFHML